LSVLLGEFFALLTAACWAQNSIVYSFAGRRVGSNTVTHIRLWIALPAITLVHLIFTGTVYPHDLSVHSLSYLSASGFSGFFLADIFIFRAFVDVGPRETLVILTLSPIFAAVISWFALEERLAILQITGITMTIAGVIWLVLAESKNPTRKERAGHIGVIFAFLGAFSQAVGMVLAKEGLADGVHPISANFLRISAGFAGLVIYSLLRKQFVRDFRKMGDRRAFLLITAGALVGPVLGIILTLYALSMAPVGVVTTIMQTSPIMLLPIDRFVFKKQISAGALAATFLAILGAMLLFIT
jgi:drug/metabolite transporter (DMT)-like permease